MPGRNWKLRDLLPALGGDRLGDQGFGFETLFHKKTRTREKMGIPWGKREIRVPTHLSCTNARDWITTVLRWPSLCHPHNWGDMRLGAQSSLEREGNSTFVRAACPAPTLKSAGIEVPRSPQRTPAADPGLDRQEARFRPSQFRPAPAHSPFLGFLSPATIPLTSTAHSTAHTGEEPPQTTNYGQLVTS